MASPTIKVKTNIRMDTTLYDILNKNLFTFLYFLIDSIDFTLTKLGAYQYLFWHTFLVKLDFNKANFDKPIPMSVYRYSCEECIPITLRKKLQELSKQPFKNSFKNLNILLAAPEAGTNFLSLSFSFLMSNNLAKSWCSVIENCKIPSSIIAGRSIMAF